ARRASSRFDDATGCLSRLAEPLESFFELVNRLQEEDLVSTIGFAHKVPQRRALFHVAGDVSHDRQMDSVVHEFLYKVAGDACSQTKEIVAQPPHGYRDPGYALLECPRDQVRLITARL